MDLLLHFRFGDMVNKWVKYWLFTGLVLLVFQFLIGAITRLTESGLSITKWEVIEGTFPPTSEAAWLHEFELYKQTPQYKEINEGMTLSDFKYIYFWEYIHRLWARLMGFVFAIPFVFFYLKKYFTPHILRRLGVVILLTILEASLGWIMVKSGLEKRPWVNAYKLSFHLVVGFMIFTCLLWTYLEYTKNNQQKFFSISDKFSFFFMVFLWVQIFLGGVMSGMKAAVYFPTWPTMNGEIFPHFLFNADNWSVENFVNYDSSLLLPALVQSLHRLTAYCLFFSGLYICYKYFYKGYLTVKKPTVYWFLALLITQLILGIITVLMCKGEIPVFWGTIHQLGALMLLTTMIVLRYEIKMAD